MPISNTEQRPDPSLPLTCRRGQGVLLLLIVLVSLPVLAAWWVYKVMPPVGGGAYGKLLATRPFLDRPVRGWPVGKWVLTHIEASPCGAECRQRRFALRQIQRAQGEAAAKLATVTIMTGEVAPGNRHAEPLMVTVPSLAIRSRPSGFYLVDPLGNQVIFYPHDAAATKVIREIGYLLKINNGLR